MILLPKLISEMSPKSIQHLVVTEGCTNSKEFRGQQPRTLRFKIDVKRKAPGGQSFDAEVVMICEKDGFKWHGLYGETDFNGLPFADQFSDTDFDQNRT